MQLTDALFDLCNTSTQPIIAIDGAAGAGKTTLASHLTAALSLRYKVTTIHMDDLYNGWDNAFDHHLTDSLVLAAQSHKEAIQYSLRYFDWSQNHFREPAEITPCELLILEGVGSSQRAVRPFLNASIWIEVDPTIGLNRVLARDGDQISPQMQRWLTAQEQHFLNEGSAGAADFVLTT